MTAMAAKPKPGAKAHRAARGVTARDGTTAAHIERAALDLFAEMGVDATTTRAIAAAAGLSEGALYRHFPSKAAIAETIFTAIHDRLARLIRAAGANEAGIEAQAGAIVDAYCETADDDWTLFAFHLLSTGRFLPTPASADNPVAAVEDIVEGAMAHGDIARRDPKLVAAMALGVVLQPALHKAHGRLEGPLTAHAGAFKCAVIAVLRDAAAKKV